ncbi:hypothetical protein O9H85_21145 [Paenibacillus filicis]|uniref:DUF86 domain-containing protein n=1 Tax=Paenibacillus gyeongsangnamensis TaxID=3388067 RepID=A0ABT4QDF7_9BACL|nr:hypothetical protein [Paenibacillus filicis]MCZ8514880.1 hypothetical protein [Paenibacillus filicis]
MNQAIIIETLESMKGYVPKLVMASETIVHDIQTHEGNWANVLVAYLEGISWLTMAIEGITRLDQNILADWDINALASVVEQLNGSLEQQDFVSLCDLLLYELQPILKSFENKLQGMIQ